MLSLLLLQESAEAEWYEHYMPELSFLSDVDVSSNSHFFCVNNFAPLS